MVEVCTSTLSAMGASSGFDEGSGGKNGELVGTCCVCATGRRSEHLGSVGELSIHTHNPAGPTRSSYLTPGGDNPLQPGVFGASS